MAAGRERDRQQEQREREWLLLESLCAPRTTVTTAEVSHVMSLREEMPDTFGELAQQYGGLMDRVLEQRVYKVEHRVSEGLRLLAEELGLVKAGPRDVIEMHATVLKTKVRGALPQKADVYAEEGRLAVLELMGYLVSYYRRQCLGVGEPHAAEAEVSVSPGN